VLDLALPEPDRTIAVLAISLVSWLDDTLPQITPAQQQFLAADAACITVIKKILHMAVFFGRQQGGSQ
jgi:hypothetical protein